MNTSVGVQTDKRLINVINKETDEMMYPSGISGTGIICLKQFYQFLEDFLLNSDLSSFSEYKREVLESIKSRIDYNKKILNEKEYDFEYRSVGLFSNLITSAFLIINEKIFHFYTIDHSYEFTGDIINDFPNFILCVCDGFLPPGIFSSIYRSKLNWYDGGLICEVIDKKHLIEYPIKIYLRVKSTELHILPPDKESEFLLNKFPVLNLDNNIQVTNIKRHLFNDAYRFPIFSDIKRYSTLAEYIHADRYAPKEQEIVEEEDFETIRLKALKFISQT